MLVTRSQEVALFLLEAGAEPGYCEDVLWQALLHDWPRVADGAQQRGISLRRGQLNAILLQQARAACVECSAVRRVIDLGARAGCSGGGGWTAMMLWAVADRDDVLQLLSERGARMGPDEPGKVAERRNRRAMGI